MTDLNRRLMIAGAAAAVPALAQAQTAKPQLGTPLSVITNPSKPTFKVTAKNENLSQSRISELGAPYFIIFGVLLLGSAGFFSWWYAKMQKGAHRYQVRPPAIEVALSAVVDPTGDVRAGPGVRTEMRGSEGKNAEGRGGQLLEASLACGLETALELVRAALRLSEERGRGQVGARVKQRAGVIDAARNLERARGPDDLSFDVAHVEGEIGQRAVGEGDLPPRSKRREDVDGVKGCTLRVVRTAGGPQEPGQRSQSVRLLAAVTERAVNLERFVAHLYGLGELADRRVLRRLPVEELRPPPERHVVREP